MKLDVVRQDDVVVDAGPFDHSMAMRADPDRYGFSHAELKVLTREEMRIGVTKEFLQARADVRLQQAKKKQLRGLASAAC